jgi:hypothetical protein
MVKTLEKAGISSVFKPHGRLAIAVSFGQL